MKVDVSHDSFTRAISAPGPAYVPGVRVEIRIPFSGSPELLYYAPSQGELTYVEGSVNGQEIVLVMSVPTDTLNPETVRSQLEAQKARIERHVQWLTADCDGYNAELLEPLAAAIRKRQDQLSKHSELARVLDIPVKRRQDPSPVFEVPVKPRRLPLQIGTGTTGKQQAPEPGISDADYATIIQQLVPQEDS